MDNSMQASTAQNHPFSADPNLNHNHGNQMAGVDQQQQNHQMGQQIPMNPDGSPIKRRPGRPKGSTKKNLLAGSPVPPKIKRPVGRPRKDGYPAGSVGSQRAKRERTQAPAVQYPGGSLTGIGYPPMGYGLSISAPISPPSNFQIDPSLDRDEWAELARNNPNAFLATLLSSLAAPNPVSSAGPTVEEAFKSHLVSLAPNPTQMQPIPSLYSILKTFWLPSSPSYFSLTASASTARTPSEHRFLYWDPQPLVFNGIACPSCSAPLTNKGRISSGPIKIYDIEKPFFVVGCEYICKTPQCIAATSPEGRKFASTDSSILRSLPVRLKDEFPAKLMYSDTDAGTGPNIWNWKALGISLSLWNMVHGCLHVGLKRDVILHLIQTIQAGVPDMLELAQGQSKDGDKKMEEEEEDEDDDVDMQDDEQQQQQQQQKVSISATPAPAPIPEGLPSGPGNFADAYSDAWKENTAVSIVTDSSKQNPVSTPAPPSVPVVQDAQTNPVTQSNATHNYSSYATYPFPPYPYLPQQIVNDMVSMVPPQQHTVTGNNSAGPSTSNLNGKPALVLEQSLINKLAGAEEVTHSKRSPRHCCKCGSQDCKGKGGRSFCMNGCQDCGKLECKGRNSRRPDKKCSEGWS